MHVTRTPALGRLGEKMKKIILFVFLFLPISLFAQDIEIKKIQPYINVIENIINGNFEITNNDKSFILIEREWYSNPRTKGQWYGELKSRYLVKRNKIVLFNEDMEEIYNIMSVYAGDPDIYTQEQNYNIGIICFQRNESKIKIMVRNDIWYLSFSADLQKDKNGIYKIINLPEYAYMND